MSDRQFTSSRLVRSSSSSRPIDVVVFVVVQRHTSSWTPPPWSRPAGQPFRASEPPQSNLRRHNGRSPTARALRPTLRVNIFPLRMRRTEFPPLDDVIIARRAAFTLFLPDNAARVAGSSDAATSVDVVNNRTVQPILPYLHFRCNNSRHRNAVMWQGAL